MADAVPAEIVQLMGSIGVRGVSRVRCKLLDGREKGKSLTRNVVGPVRKGDIIMLKETEMDAVGRMSGR